MPKMKTNRGAAKRFRKTATGKIKRNSAFTSHILTSKTTKQKRNLRRSRILSPGDAKRVQKMLPYA
jgi:large subunit ribosomal protein L35